MVERVEGVIDIEEFGDCGCGLGDDDGRDVLRVFETEVDKGEEEGKNGVVVVDVDEQDLERVGGLLC